MWKGLLGWMPLSLPLQTLLPGPIFQSHWVYSSPLKEEKMLKLCRVFMAPLCEQTSGILLHPLLSLQQLQSCLLLRLYLDAEAKGDSRQPNSVLCQSANSVLSLSPHTHRLQRQTAGWKSAQNVHSRHPGIFQWSGICCSSSIRNRGLWETGKKKVLWHLVLGSAQTSNTTFTSLTRCHFSTEVSAVLSSESVSLPCPVFLIT